MYVMITGHISKYKQLESKTLMLTVKESVYNSQSTKESKYENYYYTVFLSPGNVRDKYVLDRLPDEITGLPITVRGNLIEAIQGEYINRTFSFPDVVVGQKDEFVPKEKQETKRTAPVSRPAPEAAPADVPEDYDPFASSAEEIAALDKPKKKSAWG